MDGRSKKKASSKEDLTWRKKKEEIKVKNPTTVSKRKQKAVNNLEMDTSYMHNGPIVIFQVQYHEDSDKVNYELLEDTTEYSDEVDYELLEDTTEYSGEIDYDYDLLDNTTEYSDEEKHKLMETICECL